MHIFNRPERIVSPTHFVTNDDKKGAVKQKIDYRARKKQAKIRHIIERLVDPALPSRASEAY